MNRLLRAAWELHQFFIEHQVPYVVIGGMATQHWGEPRVTLDVDLTVMFPAGVEDFVHLISRRFQIRSADPVQFARQTRVVPIRTSNGVSADISLGVPGYEDEVMQRAVDYEIERGKRIRLCSAEDLLIHKAVAGRGKDLTDITRIIQKQGDQLDRAYIRHWLQVFAGILSDDDIVGRFERAWRAERRAASKSARQPAKRVTRKR